MPLDAQIPKVPRFTPVLEKNSICSADREVEKRTYLRNFKCFKAYMCEYSKPKVAKKGHENILPPFIVTPKKGLPEELLKY